MRHMTLRVNFNSLFKSWDVEYLNTWTNCWHTCNEYYPKAGRQIYASFKDEDEAKEFMTWKIAKFEIDQEHFKNFIPCEVPADYYGRSGVYFGD